MTQTAGATTRQWCDRPAGTRFGGQPGAQSAAGDSSGSRRGRPTRRSMQAPSLGHARSPGRVAAADRSSPAGCSRRRGHDLVHGRVMARAQAIQLSTSPPRSKLEPDLEHACNAFEVAEADLLELPTLELGNEWLRTVGALCHVDLPPSPPDAGRAQRRADREVVHVDDVGRVGLSRGHRAIYPPAAPRSTKRPKPRWPMKAPSRITGRPRTKTERTAPVTSKPS